MKDAEALDLIWNALGLAGHGWHAIEADGEIHWCEVSDRRRFMRVVANRATEGGRLCVVPYRDFEDCRYHVPSGVLWARTETQKQTSLLQFFEPKPSLLLGDGIRRTALWSLREPLDSVWALRANRRIAHHLGTLKRHAALSFSFQPPPATEVLGGTGEALAAKWIVGRLPDAPNAESWRFRDAA